MTDTPSEAVRTRLAHQRLARQGIAGPGFAAPADTVRWMGAIQAQDYHQAVWAVGLRTAGATLRTVEAAIAAGQIVRTWPMRGTIHFVAPEDAGWMVRLSAARMLKKDARRLNQLELDAATLDRADALFHEVLAANGVMTRAALLQTLEDAGISTAGQRGYHLLWHSAHRGTVCLGPLDGKQQTFALLEAWAPGPRQLDADAGLVELARRYFVSHGPADVHDFAWWAGLPMGEARAGLDGAKADLLSETFAGKDYWLGADAPPLSAESPAGFALPGFDEYLLGYTDRSAVLDPAHASQVCPGGNGVFFPMIVHDGQIVGTWKRAIKKDAVVITRAPFTPLNDAQAAAFEMAARRYADFLELPVSFG